MKTGEKKFVSMFTDVEKLYLDGMKAFHEFNASAADAVSDRRTVILAEIQKARKESKECSSCIQIYSILSEIPHNVNDISRIMRFLR